MLKKIINEIKETELESVTIIEEAKKEVLKLFQEEKKRQEIEKEELIRKCHDKGQKIIEEKTKNALEKANKIKEESIFEKNKIHNIFNNKKNRAIKMIIDRLVEKNGNISNK